MSMLQNAVNGRPRPASISEHDSAAASLTSTSTSSFSDEDRHRKRHGKKKTTDKGDKDHRSMRRDKKERDIHKKESRKKKRRHSDESNEDVRESRSKKRHHSDESNEDVRESRSKKRHHSEESSEDERQKKKRLYKEAKRLLKKHESRTNALNHLPSVESSGMKTPILHFENISDQDYYSKNNEFSAWLKEQRRVYFSDLSSDDTHRLFGEFVEAWNAHKLSEKYYEGIRRGPRTSHNWGIKDWKGVANEDEEEKLLLDSKRDKLEQKKFRKEQLSVLDELLPKETGRERILEKRAIRKEMAKAREISPEPLSEKDIMGGGDDFQRRLAQEKARKEMKAKEKATIYNEKLSAYAMKEAAAMDQMRALVEMTGGKISIRKRDQDV